MLNLSAQNKLQNACKRLERAIESKLFNNANSELEMENTELRAEVIKLRKELKKLSVVEKLSETKESPIKTKKIGAPTVNADNLFADVATDGEGHKPSDVLSEDDMMSLKQLKKMAG